MVKFSILPTATSLGPISRIMPAKDLRATASGISHVFGRGIAAALSRKAFTNGSSGMRS